MSFQSLSEVFKINMKQNPPRRIKMGERSRIFLFSLGKTVSSFLSPPEKHRKKTLKMISSPTFQFTSLTSHQDFPLICLSTGSLNFIFKAKLFSPKGFLLLTVPNPCSFPILLSTIHLWRGMNLTLKIILSKRYHIHYFYSSTWHIAWIADWLGVILNLDSRFLPFPHLDPTPFLPYSNSH